jgi:hypothetical protein
MDTCLYKGCTAEATKHYAMWDNTFPLCDTHFNVVQAYGLIGVDKEAAEKHEEVLRARRAATSAAYYAAKEVNG